LPPLQLEHNIRCGILFLTFIGKYQLIDINAINTQVISRPNIMFQSLCNGLICTSFLELISKVVEISYAGVRKGVSFQLEKTTPKGEKGGIRLGNIIPEEGN
jgi:hypothetical protein